ncbi:hypothetical protein PBAL39_20645 [Pedobacter sp. BAL39]|uniref:DMT family transporter n=1 Tax=Pedobacter sp. BAL39 TaxID=391596 RepID=UPI0001559376|nr:EamA family transporter [Pedobacter sp. BAL39]EDM38520.1 hypothetical protein PBAL39_20645 [Pedobacter sp. BAL39]
MTRKIDVKLLGALLGVALIWGTTYLGIRVAVETIPPWFVAAIRQSIASLILFAILLQRKELAWKGWPHLKRQIILSTLMVVVANGMTTVAEQTVPSGLTSLLNAMNPLFIFVASVVIGMERASVKGIVGLLFGFAGVAFIFRDGVAGLFDPNYQVGILFIGIALMGWTAGTIYVKKNHHKSENIFLDLFYQFAFSAVVQFILAFIFSSSTDTSGWSMRSFSAVAYLAIFGSVIAFFCYHYALKKVAPTEVSILSYFNTVIALFLGWLILDERITIDIVIATALIILGVVILNYKKGKPAS